MRSLKRFFTRWQNWLGVLLTSAYILVAIAAPLLSPEDPNSPGPFRVGQGLNPWDLQPAPPSIVPPLGTLPGQTDLFHALIWGTRDALSFGLVVALLAAILGTLIGAVAGYAGGIASRIMMRFTDAFLAFPIIAGVVFLNQIWDAAMRATGALIYDWSTSIWWVNPDTPVSPIQALLEAVSPLKLILIMFSWMPYARITNALVINLKQAEFIEAARAIGARPSRIILRHLLPNTLAPSLVLAARDVGSMVLIQAAFTFIGLDGSSTWGSILVRGRDWILNEGGGVFTYWWVYIPVTLAVVLFGIGWNLLGDGLGEILDPRDD